MQAVILAAGEGKRLRPLTDERPKPLVGVLGKPIIEYVIEALPDEVTELIVVVGYKGDMLKKHLGDSYNGKPITYVTQETPKGTGHALGLVKEFIKGKFLFLFADDIHGKEALKEAAAHPLAIIGAPHEDPSRFGVLEVREDGSLKHIEEKPKNPKSNLVSTGVMVLDPRIFETEAAEQPNGEFYVTDQLAALAGKTPMHVVTQTVWIPIAYPEDIPRAEERLQKGI